MINAGLGRITRHIGGDYPSHALGFLTGFLLAVWAKRAAAEGETGPPGSGASAQAISAIAKSRDQTACGASCKENEQILNAYALNPGGAFGFIDERNLAFRPKERPQFSCSLASVNE